MLLPLIVPLLLLLGILQLALCSPASTPNSSQQFRSDPYEVLRVDPQCTQKEIQRCYRSLCLKHHPDKKRNDDYCNTVGSEAKEGGSDDDFEFKEVQHAYSLIGTEEGRRNYDLRRKFNLQSSTTTNNHDAFSRYAANNRFGERAGMSGPSEIYFTFGGKSFKFSSSGSGRHDVFQRRRGYADNNPFFGASPYRREQRFREMSQQGRPRYIQKVSIPLEVLYSGGENVELKLKTSIFQRYRAAYNGGLLQPALMQGVITVLLTWLRSQKVNWFLSFFLFVSMVHVHIPPPPEKVLYSTNIREGWKGGTKVKYESANADIAFILQEGSHDTFTRVGNDLHTQVEVSAKQLRRGCTLTINPLCDSEKPIKLKLRRKEVKNGQIVTLKSRGWPKGSKEGECGDLQVKICCKEGVDQADISRKNPLIFFGISTQRPP